MYNTCIHQHYHFLYGQKRGIECLILTFYARRTLVYLEGDATMKTYEDAEGRKQSSLNIVQTKLDVLKRPQPAEGEQGL